MWPKLKITILKQLRLTESWVIFFVLGLIMMNYPFIHMFNKPKMLLGIPLLYLYLELGWLVSIFVIYLFTKAADLPDDQEDKEEKD